MAVRYWCLVWVLVGSLGAKNLSYMSSSYQAGMVFLKARGTTKLLQGASITWGYEVNPKHDWAYSRYYIFLDYGNVLFKPHSLTQVNLFTYGVGGDFMVAYNKNPVNSWAFFFGLQLGANTWLVNQKAKNIVRNTWNSFRDLVFKSQSTYFRAIGTFGVQFRTIVAWHIVDVELGMKIFLNPEPKSAFERSVVFFISHAWHF
ncbi:outer membrane protein [Helicobacter salomonis]|uniref:outer membrane protein n=1 Tax=Helicobacter salomonis TaxID=56878 RepID=UPI0018F80393|nr:outer membrane protein [Helicobacter salomonis]